MESGVADVVELLEDGELETCWRIEPSVEGLPRGDGGGRYQVGSAVDELSGHRAHVGDLERDTESGCDAASDFDNLSWPPARGWRARGWRGRRRGY